MKNNQKEISPLQRFWLLMKPDLKEVRNIYVYAIFAGLVSLTLPLGVQATVNLIQSGEVSASWVVLVIIVVAGVVANGVLQVAQLRLTENIRQKIFVRAAFGFAYRIPRLRFEILFRQYVPELANRFFDTLTLQKGLSKILVDFSAACLQVFFGLALLSLYHPVFIIYGIVLLVFLVVMAKMTGKKGYEASMKVSKQKYKLAHWLQELSRSAMTFKFASPDTYELRRTDEYSEAYIKDRESYFSILINQYWLMILFKALVTAGLLALGGLMVINKLMNIGQFIAAEIIIVLVINSVEKIISSLDTIYDVLTALSKISQLTDLEIEGTEGEELKTLDKGGKGMDVELRDVSFTYPGHKDKTLSGVSMSLAAGERVLVTGKRPLKSALLQMVADLYRPQEGCVAYHGVPEPNLTSKSIRLLVGGVFEQQRIFEGTFMENVTMGNRDLGMKEVSALVSLLKLDTYVNALPEGYNTVLKPNGGKLPRNVVTKILIARAIAKKPSLMIMDGGLESLQAQEREEIVKYMTAPERNWSLLVFSEKEYWKDHMDRKIQVDKKSVIELPLEGND
ncbi:ABC transporter ATP-binding protein (plasmid) [Fulvitalea axinellae]|uniref:ABC transporter ATP-binding protein n=1 Tax=Fulvitalea axinellae TaxID=1182444 RepID=A0AAU9D599_9BACT|nr:ABC transporter ATP-binding protein [Fulvitalea axinellae]